MMHSSEVNEKSLFSDEDRLSVFDSTRVSSSLGHTYLASPVAGAAGAEILLISFIRRDLSREALLA